MLKNIWEFFKIIIVSLIIILPIRYFIIQPFYVKGASMEPNFHDREYLIIDEISYRFKDPARGEVIVFRYPENPQEYFIKRIVGLPGESVQIIDGQVIVFNQVYPEGFVLPEQYLETEGMTFSESSERVEVGENEFFVLGDNRGASRDSRYFGVVDKSFIIGKVLLRGWPFSQAQLFKASHWPQYELAPL